MYPYAPEVGSYGRSRSPQNAKIAPSSTTAGKDLGSRYGYPASSNHGPSYVSIPSYMSNLNSDYSPNLSYGYSSNSSHGYSSSSSYGYTSGSTYSYPSVKPSATTHKPSRRAFEYLLDSKHKQAAIGKAEGGYVGPTAAHRGPVFSEELLRPFIDSLSRAIRDRLTERSIGSDSNGGRLIDLTDPIADLLDDFVSKVQRRDCDNELFEAASLVRDHKREIAVSISGNMLPTMRLRPLASLTAELSMNEASAAGLEKLYQYEQILLSSPEHRWLEARITARLRSEGPEKKITRSAMRRTIENVYFSKSISTRRPLSIKFCLQLNILEHFNGQEYKGEMADVLKDVITLTFDTRTFQTTTCAEYVRQTWPGDGEDLLETILHGLKKEGRGIFKEQGLRLNCIQEADKLVVDARGFLDQLTDAGEILMWLACALQSSPMDDLACCEPLLSVPYDDELTIEISVCTVKMPLANLGMNACWRRLFRNPAVATGFSVLRQPKLDMELGFSMEMSLTMMATLAEASHVGMVRDRVVMKGYSRFLVPTASTDGAIVWHVVCNEDGSYMSHFDPRILEVLPKPQKEMSLNDLDLARHFIGWCTVVKSSFADPVKFPIAGPSDASVNSSGYVLEKLNVSGGKYLTLGLTIARGNKDIPHRPKPDYGIYGRRLQHAQDRFVVCYDTGDRRAWLLDGATAILCLVFARLVHQAERGRPSFKFDLAALKLPQRLSHRDLALDIMEDTDNIKSIVSEDLSIGGSLEDIKASRFCFGHEVECACQAMEQLLDHQRSKADTIRTHIEDRVEGYDFDQLARASHTMNPYHCAIKKSGANWIPFARAIDAVTLFGRGFGDLFMPNEGCNKLCSAWINVPKGRDYLAARICDLAFLASQKAQPKNQKLIRLTDSLYWHRPYDQFEECSCDQTTSNRKPCQRFQHIRTHAKPVQGCKPPEALEIFPCGAVVFGRDDPLNELRSLLSDTSPSTRTSGHGSSTTSKSSGGFSGIFRRISRRIPRPGNGASEASSETSGSGRAAS